MTMGQSSAAPLVEAYWADAPPPRRIVLMIVARTSAVIFCTLLLYAIIPVHEETSLALAISAVVGLVVVAIVFGRQLARISRAQRPVLVAIEALALVVTLFVALYAELYVSLSAGDVNAFTQPIGKMDAIYFTVTVLATVGFGDISAVTGPARLAVTSQMVLDLILIGVAVKVLSTSARRAVEARAAERMDQVVPRVPAPGVADALDEVLEGAVEHDHQPRGAHRDTASDRRADQEG
jgi:hypothetical protein